MDALFECKAKVSSAQFCVGANRVPVMCWIDNVYVVAKSGSEAMTTIDLIGEQLSARWNLEWKPGSKQYMLPKGSPEFVGVEPADSSWEAVECMSVLGHLISDNGSIEADFESGLRAAWRAFFANPGSKLGKVAGLPRQCKLFSMCVVPAFGFLFGKWPPQKAYLKKIDEAQANMLGSMLDINKNMRGWTNICAGEGVRPTR